MPLGPAQHVIAFHVADDDERGVVRDVVAAIVRVEVVARHRLQVVQPADRRMPVGVGPERGRRQLRVEDLLGVVVAALQLRNHDRPLRLALLGVEQAVVHPLRLDEQQLVERRAAGGLEIGRLVDPRVAVPHPTEALDDPLHLLAGDVGGPLEIHVLDPVRRTGEPDAFVARADAVPAPHRHERRDVHLLNENGQAVIELHSAKRQTVSGERLTRRASDNYMSRGSPLSGPKCGHFSQKHLMFLHILDGLPVACDR